MQEMLSKMQAQLQHQSGPQQASVNGLKNLWSKSLNETQDDV